MRGGKFLCSMMALGLSLFAVGVLKAGGGSALIARRSLGALLSSNAYAELTQRQTA